MKFRRKIFKIVIPFIVFLFGITTCLNTFSIIDNNATNRNLKDIKYKETPASATNSIWYRVWGYNKTDSWDMGTSVAYDSVGNYYMVGRSSNSRDAAFLVKYDNSGNYKWNRTWHGEGWPEANDVTVDSSDNIYVTGSIKKDGVYVINTLKFNKTGGLKWNSTAGADYECIGDGIAIGPDNYVYVAGANYTLVGPDYVVLLKYNMTTGNIVDLRSYSGVGSTSGMGKDIAIDSSKNIYIVGTNQSGGIPNEILLLKINSTMDLNWSRSWKNPYKGLHVNQGYGVDVDSNGDIYIVGLYEAYDYFPPYYYHDGVFLKYNETGHLLWEKILHNQYNNTGLGDIYIYQDRIYICGFQGDYDDDDVLVLEYNTTGGLINKTSWGGTADDSGWGITVRNPSDIVIVGRTSSYASGFPADAFILKYYQPSIYPPGSFTLDSNAGDPDTDGNFNLTWSKSIGADNYSVYSHDGFIHQIKNNGTLEDQGIEDLNYTISGLTSGDYYYIVIAYNETGNTSSNCLQVSVRIPPKAFNMFTDANDPDTDGNFNLTWSKSIGADNYSVYSHDVFIHQIKNNGTLEVQGIEELNHTISGLTSGDYYYIVIAYNETGNTSSNCTQVSVRIPPKAFNMFTDANDPDTDGNFNLTWSKSIGADNYSVYRSNNPISNLDNCIEVKSYITDLNYTVTGMKTGTYYFVIVAYNATGFTLSDYVQVNVSIPLNGLPPAQGGNDDDDDSEDGIIPSYDIYLILILTTCISLIYYRV
ncbi:MAG: hypothetical protein EU529_13720 [Promethearchaeota archaeon]|nr:MAG: hypothetical protein EU529_13720 [Candidatus Lokiarchaeota archaeon]